MTTQVLTPTQDVADGAGLNITALLATPTATTLLFANTGRERLYRRRRRGLRDRDRGRRRAGRRAVRDQLHQRHPDQHRHLPVRPVPLVLDQNGTNQIQVVLSTITSITVALLQGVGVF